jgi:uncharacterized protein
MKKYKLCALFTFLCLTMVCLSGCTTMRSQPADFYLLSPQPLSQLAPRDELIGVLPVRVPDYLDRLQIVTRTGENTLDMNEFHRWAEPLRMNITAILVQNLSHLLRTDGIIDTTLHLGLPVRAQVGVEVQRFDGVLGGEVVLSGRWSILSGGGREALAIQGFSLQEQTESESYADLVAAMSRAIAELSRVIAEELERIL